MSLQQGQVIGQVGVTGRVTGPHCHWGLTCYGHWLDPVPVSAVIFACAADPEFERIAPQKALIAIFWLIIDQGIVIKLQKRQFPSEITDWQKTRISCVRDRVRSSCFWVPAQTSDDN
jgi:murein DD-endopeptidase MepM/ murein hydrolase activator NlpD